MAFRARRGVSDLVSEPAHSPWQGRGMLLLQGDPDPVASWAERGLMPVHVVPLDGWTAVLAAGPSQAMPPYDDTLKTLAGRPVPSRLRSARGLFAVDGNAVIRSEEHTSELQSRQYLVCRLLLEKKKNKLITHSERRARGVVRERGGGHTVSGDDAATYAAR